MKSKLYLSGPYSADTEAERLTNVQSSMAAAREVHKAGDVPIIPHLFHFWDLDNIANGYVISYEGWLSLCFEYLLTADALIVIGSISFGVNAEIKYAERLHIPVFNSLEAYYG